MNQVSEFRAHIISKPENQIYCSELTDINKGLYLKRQSGAWLTDKCFERILDIHLTYEYLLTKDLIDDNIEARVEISKQKNFADRIIRDCFLLLDHVRSDRQLRKYPCFEIPLTRIIRHLYVEHKCLCPKSTANIELLLTQAKDPLGDLSFSDIKTGISKAITELTDKQGENLFFEDQDNERLKKELVFFVTGQLDMMTTINVQKNTDAFHYLISLLREKTNLPGAKEIENSKKILLRGKPFLADHHGKIIYNYKRKSSQLKVIIENFVDKHSS
jgi:hypothetical protein